MQVKVFDADAARWFLFLIKFFVFHRFAKSPDEIDGKSPNPVTKGGTNLFGTL